MSGKMRWDRPELRYVTKPAAPDPKPYTDAVVKAEALRNAVAHHERIHPEPGHRRKPIVRRAFENHHQPCAGCTGVIRTGDQYVNRRTGPNLAWQPWHDFCWTER